MEKKIVPYTGSVVEYYSDNNIKSMAYMKEGQYNGKVSKYYDSEKELGKKIKSVNHYLNGTLDGLQSYYYENGSNKMVLNLVDGQYNGLNKIFATSAIPESTATFIKGKLIKATTKSQSGQITSYDESSKNFDAIIIESLFIANIIILEDTK